MICLKRKYAKKSKKQKEQNALYMIASMYVKCLTSLDISFLSLIYPCMICLKRKYAKKSKKQNEQNALYMIASMYSRRSGSYGMYLEGDSPYQTVMIVCELK